jgi:glycosyltransferase involved in cell wall biosynthesis
VRFDADPRLIRRRVLLVGDGPERENLEDQVRRSGLEGSVVFAGMVEYSQLAGYLAAGDVFVTASVTEVHPLTVIEALASGLPVMGIRSPGIQDTIEEGVNGFLSPEDLAGFTAKLARIVAEPETRRRMADQARRSAGQYAIGRPAALIDRYQRLVAARPTRRANRWRMAWQRLVTGDVNRFRWPPEESLARRHRRPRVPDRSSQPAVPAG